MLTSLFGAGGLLLLAAGAAKVADPTRTAGALRSLGWPSAPALVRAGATVEALVGAAAVVVGGRALAVAVGASYLGFAGFVSYALATGAPIGSCGCFGRADTAPCPAHVVIDLALAAAALAAAVADPGPLLDAEPLTVVAAALLAVAAYAGLTQRSPFCRR